MREVVERSGTVIGMDAGVARVRLAPAPGCAGCGSRGACASAAAKPQIVEVRLPSATTVGSEVTLSIPESSVVLAALLGYLLPIVGLMVGAVAAIGFVDSDLSAVIGAGAGFLLGLLGARRISSGAFHLSLAPSACQSDSLSFTGDRS